MEINQATSQKLKCRIPLKGSHVHLFPHGSLQLSPLFPPTLGRTASEMKSHALSILTRFPTNPTGLS